MKAPEAVYRGDGNRVGVVRVDIGGGVMRDGCPACLTPLDDYADCPNLRCDEWSPLCDFPLGHHHLRYPSHDDDILRCVTDCELPGGSYGHYGPLFNGPHD